MRSASLGEDPEFVGSERCRWSSGAGLQRGDEQLRSKGLQAIASWSASKAGAGISDGDTGGGGALHGRSSEFHAGCARYAHHDSVAETMPARWRWRPWLVGLAQSGRLESLPAYCASARWSPPGAIRAWRAPPRPAPPRPLAASSSSKFSRGRPGCPPARLHCFSEGRARAAKCVQANGALHTRDSRPSGQPQQLEPSRG